MIERVLQRRNNGSTYNKRMLGLGALLVSLVCQHIYGLSLAWSTYSINRNIEEDERGQLVVKEKTF